MEEFEGLPVVEVGSRGWYDFDVLRRLGHLGDSKLTRFQFVDRNGLQHGGDYIFTSNHGAVKAERTSKNDRVLVSCEWMQKWKKGSAEEAAPKSAKRARKDKEAPVPADAVNATDSDMESIATDESICLAPAMLLRGVKMPDRIELSMLPKIQLNEEEWFRNWNLDFRGERHPLYLYVRALDVTERVGLRARLGERESIDAGDYIKVYNGGSAAHFLRYRGLLRLLFSLRKNKLVDEFQTWATNVLFRMQFPGDGTGPIMSASHSLCRPLLQATVGELSGFFVFWLSTVDELRTVLAIPESYQGSNGVYHLEFTTNLASELTRLRDIYKARTGAVVSELYVTLFTPIDATLIGVARRRVEHEIRELLPRRFFPFANTPLYALSETDLTLVRMVAAKIHAEMGAGLVDHSVSESKRAMAIAHREEIKTQQRAHEEQLFEMRSQLLEHERKQTQHERQLLDLRCQLLDMQKQLVEATSRR